MYVVLVHTVHIRIKGKEVTFKNIQKSFLESGKGKQQSTIRIIFYRSKLTDQCLRTSVTSSSGRKMIPIKILNILPIFVIIVL